MPITSFPIQTKAAAAADVGLGAFAGYTPDTLPLNAAVILALAGKRATGPVLLSEISTTGAVAGQVLKFNGTALVWDTDNVGSGGGGGGLTSFAGRTGPDISPQSGDYSFAQIASKPTTLSGYGIADAAPLSHVGAGGAQHAVVTTTVAGFMAAADKVKLDGIATGATANSSDALLLDRANHTGTQAVSTISGLQTTLDAKAPLASPTFTGTVAGITKAMVGLGNVDNTSDANKPVSTAQAAAISARHVNILFQDEGVALGSAGTADTLNVTGYAVMSRASNVLTLNVPSPVWGTFTGSLAAQVDLTAALTSNIALPYDMPGTVIDVTQKGDNRFICSAPTHALTFSATPADGAQFTLEITGYSSDCTVTIPSCRSEVQQANITSFVVPANTIWTIYFQRTATGTKVIGEPLAADGPAVSIASAATTNIGQSTSRQITITGTTTITSFGNAVGGTVRYGQFAGALTLTHNSSDLRIAGGANVLTAAGDKFVARASADNVWEVYVVKGAAPAYIRDTWANVKNLTPASGTEAYVTDLFGGCKLIYSGTRWKGPNNHVAAFVDGQTYPLPDTASTAEQLLAHATLLCPAGFIGPKDTISVEWTGSHTADAGTNGVEMRLRVGTAATGVTGTSISQRTAVNATGTTRRNNELRMNNSVTSQTLFNAEVSSMESSNAISTTAIDFSVDQYFKFCFKQATASTGQPNLRGFTITIKQA